MLANLATNLTLAQDVITKKSGDDVQAKVIEVTSTEIKYKNADNVNGPLFTILKAELMKNNAYNQAYTEQAHKIKKKKIWSSFGISSDAWLLLILLL